MHQIHVLKRKSYWVSCTNHQRLALPPTDTFLNMKACGGYSQEAGEMVWYSHSCFELNTIAIK